MSLSDSDQEIFQIGSSLKDIGILFKNPPVYQKGLGCFQLRKKYQKGRGVGNIFANLYRYLKPLILKGLKSVGKEAFTAGTDILSTVAEGKISPKEAIKSRSKEAVRKLKRKAIDKIENILEGSGMSSPKVKRKRTCKKKKESVVKKPKKKIKRRSKKGGKNNTRKRKRNNDIFD